MAALDAVIDFLPIALAEPLRALEERLDDKRPCGNRKGRGTPQETLSGHL